LKLNLAKRRASFVDKTALLSIPLDAKHLDIAAIDPADRYPIIAAI
jgi:hypothetical protein